jgi:hypothetical protein
MGINKRMIQSLISFSFVASSIAILMGLIIDPTHSIVYNPADVYIVLALQFLILIIFTFLVNLLIPVAKNTRMGVLITIPTFIVLLYFYQIYPFFDNDISNRFYYIVTVACLFGPILEILELIVIFLFSRLGTIANTKLLLKHAN